MSRKRKVEENNSSVALSEGEKKLLASMARKFAKDRRDKYHAKNDSPQLKREYVAAVALAVKLGVESSELL